VGRERAKVKDREHCPGRKGEGEGQRHGALTVEETCSVMAAAAAAAAAQGGGKIPHVDADVWWRAQGLRWPRGGHPPEPRKANGGIWGKVGSKRWPAAQSACGSGGGSP